MKQAVLKILLGGTALFCGTLYGLMNSLKFEITPPVIITLLGLAVLEVRAPRHPEYGFAPSTFGLYLFLALMPGGSVGLAVGAAVTLIALRSTLSQRDHSMWEFLVDALAVVGSLVLLKVLARFGPEWSGVPVAAVVLSALLHFMIRPILQDYWVEELPADMRNEWESRFLGATTLIGFSSFLAVPYALLAGVNPYVSVLLPLGPFMLSTVVEPAISGSEGTVERSRPKPKTAAPVTQLDIKKDDFGFLKDLNESLHHEPTLRGVLEKLMWLARRLAQSDSTVIFLEEEGKLRAAEVKSAYRQQLDQAFSEGREEPVVRRALDSGQVEFLRAGDAEGGRIFGDEQMALAVPIHNQGAIYLGRSEESPFGADEVSRMSILGHQAYLALTAARFCEAGERAHRNETEARRQRDLLKEGTARTAEIVAGVKKVPAGEKLEWLGSRLVEVVPHDYYALFAGKRGTWPPAARVVGPPGRANADEDVLLELAHRVVQEGEPLLCNDLKASSLPRPSKGSRSVLGCGLPGGAILLFSASTDAFEDEHRALLVNLAAHLEGR